MENIENSQQFKLSLKVLAAVDQKLGVGKCLMIVKGNENVNTTIGSAAVQCASKRAKLVSFTTCSSLDAMVIDLKDYDGISHESFWFGVFAPGKENKKIGKRNFLEDEKDWIIDSCVYEMKFIPYM